jgi:hypothetical protein
MGIASPVFARAGSAFLAEELSNPALLLAQPEYGGSIAYWDIFKHEMWHFQILRSLLRNVRRQCPPMQEGAHFNIGDLREKLEQAIANARASSD